MTRSKMLAYLMEAEDRIACTPDHLDSAFGPEWRELIEDLCLLGVARGRWVGSRFFYEAT